MNNTPDKPHSKRRWMKFGLRAMFVLVTIVAICSAWVGTQVQRCHREANALAQLVHRQGTHRFQVLYGSAFRHYEFQERPGSLDGRFVGGPAWLAAFLGVDIFRTVTSLDCSTPGNTFRFVRDDFGQFRMEREFVSGVKDEELQWINDLPNLRFLNFGTSGITDKGLRQLTGMKLLETLWLEFSPITDAGLQVLSSMPNLKELDITGTEASDGAVSYIMKCQQLKKLDVGSTHVTEDGIERLKRELPNCEIIH